MRRGGWRSGVGRGSSGKLIRFGVIVPASVLVVGRLVRVADYKPTDASQPPPTNERGPRTSAASKWALRIEKVGPKDSRQGLTKGKQKGPGASQATESMAELLGFELDAKERQRMQAMSADELERLAQRIRSERRWPSEG
jgi:hypothetical protein